MPCRIFAFSSRSRAFFSENRPLGAQCSTAEMQPVHTSKLKILRRDWDPNLAGIDPSKSKDSRSEGDVGDNESDPRLSQEILVGDCTDRDVYPVPKTRCRLHSGGHRIALLRCSKRNRRSALRIDAISQALIEKPVVSDPFGVQYFLPSFFTTWELTPAPFKTSARGLREQLWARTNG